jgi:hypothetical protein
MATFNVPMIGTEVKPVPQTSLADMIGMARGAQAYQQAEQINPLALQQQQQAARTGQIQLGVVEQGDIERRNLQTFFADPNNFQTDGRIDIDKINAQVPKIAPLTGPDYVQKITTLGTAQTEGLKAKQNLTQDQRALIGSTLGVAGRFGVDDPQIAIRELRMLADQNPNNADLKNLVEKSYVPIFSQMQKGPGVTDALIKASQAIMSPTQQQTSLAPTITTTPEGKTITTTPGVGITPPTSTMGMAGGLQANVPSTGGPSAVGAGAEIAPGMRVPYPVRRADQPYMPEPSEAKDQLSGQTYRDRLIAGQGELPQGKRNVEEVIKQANLLNEDLYSIEKGGGFPGLIGRKIRMAVNSAEYDMLAKDLARMALSNSTAMGGAGNTVSGLDMAQVANGTIKMPPEKLVGIARRVQADQTNLDLQAKGAQIFAQSHGDNNMKAYQQAWNANADTKIFEAMNIYKAISDPQKRKDQIDALLGNDPAKRKEFFDMYENILSLSNTGLTKVKKDK